MPYNVGNRTGPFDYTCPDCGKKGTTRFPIDANRPFYCSDCWRKRRGSTPTSAGD